MVIRTKIMAPVEPQDVIVRPRLEDQLEDAWTSRVSLVQAPAGYGKTTLLMRWFQMLRQQGAQVAWLTVDTLDRSAYNIIRYIAAALGNVVPSLMTTPEAMIEVLVDRLADSDSPVFLFLDDLHLLDGESLRALSRLIETAPGSLHFVVASRVFPELPLARVRAKGELLEIGMQELLFTAEESARFMAGTGHENLSPAELSAVQMRTEGWITGLRLASLSMRRAPDRASVISAFTGKRKAVADFFAEDVFAQLNADLQSFLRATSVLERLCPHLCDSITGRRDSREMLAQIESTGLFLAQLDEAASWYRYHSLFAEFLQRELAKSDSEAEFVLHRRASEWFVQAQLLTEALDHAVKSRDRRWLAELLEANCESMTYTGKIRQVADYAAHLPEHVLAQFPMLLLTLAWLRTRNLSFAETTRLMSMAERRLDEMAREGTHSPEDLARHRLMLLHREMTLAAAEDDMQRVERQCQFLIREFRDERPFISCTLYGQLIAARREQFEFKNLEELETVARSVLKQSGHSFAAVSLESIIGASLFTAGKTDAARRALEKGLAEGVRAGGAGSGFAALPALPLSEVLYEMNELDRASQLVQLYLPAARDFGFVDQLIAGYVIHPRLLQAYGEGEAALQALEAGLEIVGESGLERLRLNLLAEQLRLAIRNGQPRLALDKGRAMGLPSSVVDILPTARSTTRCEIRALAWVRLASLRGCVPDALSAARRWRSFCSQRGAVRPLIRWQLLLAQLLWIDGQTQSAQRALREAVTSAAPGRFIRSFIDEGSPVHTLLRSAYESGPVIHSPVEIFVRDLLQIFEPQAREELRLLPPASGPLGKLSPKEIEILALVGSGMRNREIGNRLGLTEGSVKWYLQQVYDKVGMRRRSQAVDCARKFGLLN